MEEISVYIHIPFCQHRCAYCDFNTYAGIDHLIPEYVDALQKEIHFLTKTTDQKIPVNSIYFGGGTPSLLPIQSVEQIIQTVKDGFNLSDKVEISLEANPGTLSLEYLTDLNTIGINRISLGMQSAHQRELALLERYHSFEDVIEAVEWSRKAGLNNINLDLIFGLPSQSAAQWEKSIKMAISLSPEHFSLYSLTIESGTPMHSWVSKGLISEPDPDMAAEMYILACSQLAEAGYLQYEISSWARRNKENDEMISAEKSTFINEWLTPSWACRHNLQYWRNLSFLGIGAGSHGYFKGYRLVNELNPQKYIQRLCQSLRDPIFPCSPANLDSHLVDDYTEMRETMMMSLRLTREGISRSQFQDRFDRGICTVFEQEIEKLTDQKLLEWVKPNKEILRLTPEGRLLGNLVFREFV
jgi:oxygen-independent coproporphyrinogen-3 oxidase